MSIKKEITEKKFKSIGAKEGNKEGKS